MKYEILGKKIVSCGGAGDELTIGFDDGVFITLKATTHFYVDSAGRLKVSPTIQVSTDKVELEAEAE